MAVNAGQMDRRITLLTGSATPDADYGYPTEATATLATRWASRRALSTQEKFAAGMDVGTVAMEYRVRWDSTIDAALDNADSLTDGGTSYDIRGVSEGDGYHVELVILAEAKR
jgi:SPP1 family predicted phage head-tail adaptor